MDERREAEAELAELDREWRELIVQQQKEQRYWQVDDDV